MFIAVMLRRMNLHVGMDAISNPINTSAKESELKDVKFGFSDDEHIYDDPNLLLGANGRPELPEPYNTLSRTADGQAKLDLSSAAAGSAGKQPQLPAALGSRARRGCNDDNTYSEPRYTALNQQFQESSLSSTYTPASPPHSTFLPPGYASPRSQTFHESCVPQPTETAPPDYDDCIVKVKPSSGQAPPRSEDYHRLIHQAPPPKTSLPPGYASPKSLGFLASQSEPGNLTLAEEEAATPSSFKPQVKSEETKAESGEAKSGGAYFPLRKKSMHREGDYQEVSGVSAGGKASSTDGSSQPEATRPEDEDQYVVMNSLIASVPELQ